MSKEKIVCESTQKSAEHYNTMIWTIFSVGVFLSLFVLKEVWDHKLNFGYKHFFMSFLGFFVLFYCILTIESFGQKKSLMYNIHNREIKKVSKIDFAKAIRNLPFYRTKWLAEIVLLIIFLIYVFLFYFY